MSRPDLERGLCSPLCALRTRGRGTLARPTDVPNQQQELSLRIELLHSHVLPRVLSHAHHNLLDACLPDLHALHYRVYRVLKIVVAAVLKDLDLKQVLTNRQMKIGVKRLLRQLPSVHDNYSLRIVWDR
eukprot:scaffold4473_cov421-Prasinococcus_capsulatus_cf.AAC.10